MSDCTKQELEIQDISILALNRTEAPKCAQCVKWVGGECQQHQRHVNHSVITHLSGARSDQSFPWHLYLLVIIVFLASLYTNACHVPNEKGKG